jgi:hypothetical protein
LGPTREVNTYDGETQLEKSNFDSVAGISIDSKVNPTVYTSNISSNIELSLMWKGQAHWVASLKGAKSEYK